MNKYIILLIILLLNISGVSAWTNTDGGNHDGDDWTISTDTTISGIHTNVGTFTLNNGVTATLVQGVEFELYATNTYIYGTINGDGKGYLTAQGPGAGTYDSAIAGGGGYGTSGGNSTWASTLQALGGVEYGTSNGSDIDMGSGGGSSTGVAYAPTGGGSVLIESISLYVSGTISCNGIGEGYRYGAGSGGGILLLGESVSLINANLSAMGGDGRLLFVGHSTPGYSSGAGAGGRIKIFSNNYTNTTSTINLQGGNGSLSSMSDAGDGTFAFSALYHNITVEVRDVAALTPVLNYTATIGSTSITTTNGTVIFYNISELNSNILITADGYFSGSGSVYSMTDTNISVYLDRIEQNYYPPHYAAFILTDIWGNLYKNVDAKVYLANTVVLSGVTGNDGSITFRLMENVKYTITFTSTSQGISKSITLFPSSSQYYIYVSSISSQPEESMIEDVRYYWDPIKINNTIGNITLYYTDNGNVVSNVQYWVNYTNGTNIFNISTDVQNYTNTVTVNPSEASNYSVHIIITHPTLGIIDQTKIIYFPIMQVDLGYDAQWKYAALAFMMIALVAGLFSMTDVHIGGVVIVIMAWFFRFIGWFDSNTTNTLLLLLATIVAIVYAMQRGEK